MATKYFQASIVLPADHIGLVGDLRAQPKNDTPANVGAAISAGFTEIGGGAYYFHAMVDETTTFVVFYVQSTTEQLGSLPTRFPTDPPSAADIDALLSTNHGAGLWSGVVVQVVPTPNATVYLEDFEMNARRSDAFTPPPISFSGISSVGWTAFTFTVKRDPLNDDDDESIIYVRVSNPGDPGDGLIIQNGRDASDVSWGTLAISGVTPNTILQPILDARGMNIDPSVDTAPYVWEIKRYSTVGQVKTMATGNFNVAASVRRNPV